MLQHHRIVIGNRRRGSRFRRRIDLGLQRRLGRMENTKLRVAGQLNRMGRRRRKK
ncbi:hypothetical protein LINPERHAP1_LOCUS30806 [Linum perenne]